MKVENLPTNTLLPYPSNPRKNDHAVPSIAASIKEFGFKQPIVIDSTKTIVVGHTRWKAAQLLGLTEVPCVLADDLTPQQIKAYRILDNKLAEKAEWDAELLKLELDDIELDFEPFEVEFLPEFNPDMLDDITLPNGGNPSIIQKTFTITLDQSELVEEALSQAKNTGNISDADNKNSNGNALAYICQSFITKNA